MTIQHSFVTTLRLLAPTIMAIVLFIVAIFAVLIPSTEDAIMERKKETIKELYGSCVEYLESLCGSS